MQKSKSSSSKKGKGSISSKMSYELPATKTVEVKKCYISYKIKDGYIVDGKKVHTNIAEIQNKVCVDDKNLIEHEGEFYCIFHLPKKEKDIQKFERLFYEKLKSYKKDKLDFRYVWFPSKIELSSQKFLQLVDFSSATFTENVDLNSAIFTQSVSFNSANFEKDADFSAAIFLKDASFTNITVLQNAYFGLAVFGEEARFNLAKLFGKTSFIAGNFFSKANFDGTIFSSETNFNRARFFGEADFSSVKFDESSQAYFVSTEFCSTVKFCQAQFVGNVEFENDVFLDEEQVQQIEKDLDSYFIKLTNRLKTNKIDININKTSIKLGQKADLDLSRSQAINFQTSFYLVRLCPSWLANTNAQAFTFRKVKWRNVEIDFGRDGLNKEIRNLKDRKLNSPEEVLSNTFNQLAHNAETHRRFEEVKLFRKQEIALRNEDCYVHDAIEDSDKANIRKEFCLKYPVVNEKDGNYYCLLHYPDKNKAEMFSQELKNLLEEGHSDFRGVTFPVSLNFNGTLQENMDFSYAVFQRRVIFQKAIVNNLVFKEARFNQEAELIFEDTICHKKISFEKAVFEGKFTLNGSAGHEFFKNPDEALTLKGCQFDNPQLVNFRSVKLRPHYFVGIDASKFNFHDCNWKEKNANKVNFLNADNLGIKKELGFCSYKELAQTANQLAINYEENRNFEESSIFRYMAMQTKRFEEALNGWFWTLDWLYWWSSGYGERRLRAAVNLLLILILFDVLYTTSLSKFDYGEKSTQIPDNSLEQKIFCCADYGERIRPMNLDAGLVHSLSTAAFLRPDPKPADSLTKLIVFLESVLAPLQATLLALAIRRKFMR